MPLDPHAQRFLKALAFGQRAEVSGLSVGARRAGLARLMQLGREDYAVAATRPLTLPGASQPLAARLYESPGDPPGTDTPGTDTPGTGTPGTGTSEGTPAGVAPRAGAPGAGILYLHGGGLVAGSIETHDAIARALCRFSGARVLSLEYRLAPEAPFPAALEDVAHVLEHLVRAGPALGIAPERLVLCGDSAGGTLAAASAAQRRVPLALLVLLCPILDYAHRSASRRELASGYFLDEATLEHDLRHYLPAAVPVTDPRISPLLASSFEGLPPTLVHTAEFDPLRDEGRDYFKRLESAGSALSYTCHAGMIHLFYGLGAVIPHARAALEQIGREIRTALDRGNAG